MKFPKYTILMSALLSGAAMTGCNDIEETDRLVPNPRPEVKCKVAVFEFTGQRCSNCPAGAEAMHNILNAYPDQVYAINLHPENTTYTIPIGNAKLTSPAATFLYEQLKPSAFPSACVDLNSPVTNTAQWSSLTADALKITAPATIALSSSYDESTRGLTIDWSVAFNDYTTQEMMLQLYLVEDGIIGMQTTNGAPIRDYEHNHVLRTTFFPEWGKSLGNLFAIGQTEEGGDTVTLDEGWKAENCHVVACLLNAGRIVCQAEAVSVANTETDTPAIP